MWPTRTTDPSCPSPLAMDRFLTDEMPHQERAQLEKHLPGCAACRARLEEARGSRAAFTAAAPRFEDLVAQARPRPDAATPEGLLERVLRWMANGRRWQLALGGAMAASAALVLLVLRPAHDDGAGDYVGVKGGRLGFYVKEGEQIEPGRSGMNVRAGASLQFTVSVAERRHLAVLSLDARREAQVYFPGGDSTEPIGPGAALPLPSSVVLDDSVGREQLLALFCDRPQQLAPLRSALVQAADVAKVRLPAGCQGERLHIMKVKANAEAARPKRP